MQAAKPMNRLRAFAFPLALATGLVWMGLDIAPPVESAYDAALPGDRVDGFASYLQASWPTTSHRGAMARTSLLFRRETRMQSSMEDRLGIADLVTGGIRRDLDLQRRQGHRDVCTFTFPTGLDELDLEKATKAKGQTWLRNS
jgi:hypothetical protein